MSEETTTREVFLKRSAAAVLGMGLAYIGIKPAEARSPGEQRIVNIARNFLGTPYVLNGTSLRHGVDCDGFTRGVLRKVGIYAPLGPTAQFYGGRRRRGAPRAGDVHCPPLVSEVSLDLAYSGFQCG
jgi:hypothetical protein